MLELGQRVLEGLTVDEERMRANIELSDGGVFSERVMMALAERIGRQQAHELVHEVAMDAFERGSHLRDALAEHPTVRAELGGGELAELFAPEPLLETAAQMVDTVCGPR